MTAPAVWDGDLLLFVREHAPVMIEEAEAKGHEFFMKSQEYLIRANQLRALLDAASTPTFVEVET